MCGKWGLSLRLSSLVPWGLGDRMDRGNEGACVGHGAIPETVYSMVPWGTRGPGWTEGMRTHVLYMGLSLRLSSLVPWGLGNRMDRGNEDACVGHGAIPETVLSGLLGTTEQDGQRE